MRCIPPTGRYAECVSLFIIVIISFCGTKYERQKGCTDETEGKGNEGNNNPPTLYERPSFSESHRGLGKDGGFKALLSLTPVMVQESCGGLLDLVMVVFRKRGQKPSSSIISKKAARHALERVLWEAA